MGRLILTALTCWLTATAAHAQLCTIDYIMKKVCLLQSGFATTPVGAAPGCEVGGATPTQTQLGAIRGALQLVNESVNNGKANRLQADLCNLTEIFVAGDSGGISWGKWANPAHNYPLTTVGNTYIAIMGEDIDANSSFAKIKNKHLSILNSDTAASYTPITGDSNAVGALYALAHELGHIKWRRDGIECFNSELVRHSWDSTNDPKFQTYKARDWTDFAESFGSHLDHNLPPPKGAPDDQLLAMFDDGFITALAAANPEEDFVESYAVRVVNTVSPNTVVQIKFGSQKRDLKFDREGRQSPRGKGLSDKAACIDGLITWQSASAPSAPRVHTAPPPSQPKHRRRRR